MINLEQAKDYTLKKINTPIGEMVLYGYNLIPDTNTLGLIFYRGDKQIMFFSIDCELCEQNQTGL